jgi:glutamine synthetase
MNNQEAHSLFNKYKVLSKRELKSRFEIYVETYAKHINIEARTAIMMVRTLYIPAVIAYTGVLAETIVALKTAGAPTAVQEILLKRISDLLASANAKVDQLEAQTHAAHQVADTKRRARAFRDKVFPAQTELRQDIDALETMLPSDLWPVPSYADILFGL